MLIIMALSAIPHLASPRRLIDAITLGKIKTDILTGCFVGVI